MSAQYTQLGDHVQYKITNEGVGEKPHQYQEVFYFFICRDSDKNFISGSQHLATRSIIGRNMLNPHFDAVLSIMSQGQGVECIIDNLLYEIEMIRFGKVCTLPWQLSGDELPATAQKLKLSANESLKSQVWKQILKLQKKQYDLAFSSYNAALRLVNNSDQQELQKQLHSNMCLCALKLKRWDQCLDQANLALSIEPNNVKILHRCAIAKVELGDFDGARQDLQRAHTLDPLNQEVTKEILEIGKREKSIKDKQSAIYKKMIFGE